MPELFDTGQIRDDSEYWDALAGRVTAHAAGSGSGLAWLARSTVGWSVGSLLTAVALASVVVWTNGSSTRPREDWVDALAPADTVGRAIFLADGPPAIGILLFGEGGS
ncbi:MAG TPA: hypothetical protein VF981_05795 [Gemmatimonadaceae bacterium]